MNLLIPFNRKKIWKSRYRFGAVRASKRLKFIRLSEKNAAQLHELFRYDPSTFVDARFKDLRACIYYAQESKLSLCFRKDAGVDWLVKLKENKTIVGVVHVYDLSIDTNLSAATVGFAIGEQFRKQGYGYEAVNTVIKHFCRIFGTSIFLSKTDKQNQPSHALLIKLGFSVVGRKKNWIQYRRQILD